MRVADCMSSDVKIIDPEATIEEAAKLMRDNDVGAIPVGENDRLIGMITDRDIAIRAVADNKGGKTRVREVMTEKLEWVSEDADLIQVSQRMAHRQVRRMPVINHEKRLIGMISIGDMAQGDRNLAGHALAGSSRHH